MPREIPKPYPQPGPRPAPQPKPDSCCPLPPPPPRPRPQSDYTDLKILFRFIKRKRHLVTPDTPFDSIDITDVDLDFIKSIKIEEMYRYQSFSPENLNSNNSLSAASRCRRTSNSSISTRRASVRHRS